MIQKTVTLGSLTCRVLQGGDEGTPPELVVVLCHGFGAPGDDLVPLGAELLSQSPGARVRFVFPAAPLSLGSIGYGEGRAWWNLDMERLMAIQRGDAANAARMRAEIPDGLPKARMALLSLLEETSRQTKLSPSRMVLGGFSQGAMLATDVALRMEEAPAALGILSGTLICEAEWAKRAPARRGLRVLQSHGTYDPILPFDNAVALRELLVGAGLKVDFTQFPGEHGIPPQVLVRLATMLRELLSPSSPP
jgi:phospholipase/carboxylesterase